ncbi:hypothetical protein [Clostridium butyricum]|uniref:hypothetical protein n=1 Tax=Clostridium butyricum TaxID=1492 RepID=UPI0018AB233A|nr:hypothetical protein [Clostridium butyricum]
MSFQDITIARNTMENTILDLEKKYFSIISNVLTSNDFVNDLLLIEKEIRENYPKFKDTWDLKNKLKIPAERLVRHHIYTQLNNLITGIYPSPISSDLGIKLQDTVLCIDVKTVDTVGNKVDITSTQVEKNQISFQNTNHPYITTKSNLESIDHYSRLPVLTYVVKIIYNDDDYSFSLSRMQHPSLVLACIPNGEISKLFNNDIIYNFKTYDYYTEKDNPCFKEIIVPPTCKTPQDQNLFVQDYCVNQMNFSEIKVNKSKSAYYDATKRVIWWLTSINNKKVIRAVKSGSTARLSNEVLKKRYDSHNNIWDGYIEMPIPNPLP